MILGIGTDIVDNERMQTVISKYGQRFLNKVFSSREAARLRKSEDAQRAAATFAAKEALVKALGTGFRYGISLCDIEVIRDRHGKPRINLSGRAEDFARKMGVKHIHLSLSHEKSHSVAVVLLES